MPAKKTIFIFGDSITYGEWDSEGGWANRLRTYFDGLVLPLPQDYIVSYNLGIPSDTSTGVAQRITEETQARLTPNPNVKEIQFIIAIGTNDSRWLINEEKYGVDEAEFKSNLKAITVAAKEFTSDIVFIGLVPCIEKNVLKTAKRFQWDSSYHNQSIQRYNEIIKQHCSEVNLDFIDVNSVFEKNNPDSLFSDGLHPNNEGHALMFETIVNQLNMN